MKLQLIHPSKLKIIFDLQDLKENEISLHSFLSGSKKSKTFLKAILELANEDFGINFFILSGFSERADNTLKK